MDILDRLEERLKQSNDVLINDAAQEIGFLLHEIENKNNEIEKLTGSLTRTMESKRKLVTEFAGLQEKYKTEVNCMDGHA